jgi:hypothetical protein
VAGLKSQSQRNKIIKDLNLSVETVRGGAIRCGRWASSSVTLTLCNELLKRNLNADRLRVTKSLQAFIEEKEATCINWTDPIEIQPASINFESMYPAEQWLETVHLELNGMYRSICQICNLSY